MRVGAFRRLTSPPSGPGKKFAIELKTIRMENKTSDRKIDGNCYDPILVA